MTLALFYRGFCPVGQSRPMWAKFAALDAFFAFERE